MARSANGWSVLEKAPPEAAVPGTDPPIGIRVRPGDVAVVLMEVARRWHEEVERLDLDGPRDEWGWAYRPIRGQETGFSNHASGTAIDLNATRHPRGVPTSRWLTDQQISRCRAIVQSMRDKDTGTNVVRWGGDYATVPDAMHWEVNADAAAVKRVAARIRSKNARDPMEEIMATAAERAALAKDLAPLLTPAVADAVVAKLLPTLRTLTSRDEDGLYIRATGTRAVFQVIGGVRVWVDLDDYEAVGRPEVQDIPPTDDLFKLRLVGARPPVGSE